jgi:hypothetical protein
MWIIGNPFAGMDIEIRIDSKNEWYKMDGNCLIDIADGDYPNSVISGFKNSIIPNYAKSIGIEAFYNTKGLKEIVIPESINEISWNAFDSCEDLESITFFEGLKDIGLEAFINCGKLKDVVFPSTLRYISRDAFKFCNSLVSITVAENNSIYLSDNNCLIVRPNTEMNKNQYYYLMIGCKTSVIPEYVHRIGSGAFYGITSMLEIVIPYHVETIGDSVFGYWTSEQTIYIEGRSHAPSAWYNSKGGAWNNYCQAKIIWNA